MSHYHILKIIGVGCLGGLLPSCSLIGLHTGSQLREKVYQSHQRGILEGKTQEVRRAFHQAQLEQEQPAPPPEIDYYRIPVRAHTSSDGVLIEPHIVTIPIIKN